MNGINYTLLGVALLFAVTVGVTNYRRRRKEDKGELSGLKGQLYRPANLPYGWLLPQPKSRIVICFWSLPAKAWSMSSTKRLICRYLSQRAFTMR